MTSLVSQVYAYFYGWDGIKHSIKMFETSNRLIKDFYYKGIDAILNPSTVKQLFQYNRQAFNKLVVNGIMFEYQYITYTLTVEKKRYMIKAYNPKTGLTHRISLTQTGIKQFSKNGGHNDITDMMDGLIKVIN